MIAVVAFKRDYEDWKRQNPSQDSIHVSRREQVLGLRNVVPLYVGEFDPELWSIYSYLEAYAATSNELSK